MRGRGRVVAAVLAGLAAGGCGGEVGVESGPPPPVGVEVGYSAPPLVGRLPTGEEFRLAPSGAPVVLVFYRGGYCGLCRLRLEQLERQLPAYRSLGAAVVAVTPEPPGSAAETARLTGASFPIVSVDSATLGRWEVVPAPGVVPHPAAYLLDDRGVILYRHLGGTAADRATDATLLALLERWRENEGEP